jgi:hypothetical protein
MEVTMSDPRDKPAPEPTREGGVKSPEQPAPANENVRVDEVAPKPREDGREGGMIGEG